MSTYPPEDSYSNEELTELGHMVADEILATEYRNTYAAPLTPGELAHFQTWRDSQ